jgi:hypothetical protein
MDCDFKDKREDEPCWGEVRVIKNVLIEEEEFFNYYDITCCKGHAACFDRRAHYVSHEASKTDKDGDR